MLAIAAGPVLPIALADGHGHGHGSDLAPGSESAPADKHGGAQGSDSNQAPAGEHGGGDGSNSAPAPDSAPADKHGRRHRSDDAAAAPAPAPETAPADKHGRAHESDSPTPPDSSAPSAGNQGPDQSTQAGQQDGSTGRHGRDAQPKHDKQNAAGDAPAADQHGRAADSTPAAAAPAVTAPAVTAAAPAPAPAPTAPAAASPATHAQRHTGPAGSSARGTPAGGRAARRRAAHRRARAHHQLAAPARWTPAATVLAPPGGLQAAAANDIPRSAPDGHPEAQPRHHAHGGGLFLPVVFRALARTIAVIPVAVWLAMAGLAAFGLAMLAFAAARHRRARALARERVALMADLHALEGAVLPTLPAALGGVALSVATAPALGPASGGDFHDAFSLSRDRAAIIVGDVAGQGRQALADAQLVRHAVRAYLEAGLDPRAAIAMTGAVVDEREEPLFASVLVAVHDRRDGTLTFASAGHEPPIFVTEHGAGLPPVTGWSPPLGTGLDTGRRQTSIPLPEGQAVCLLTDGATEARSLGERIGVSRVIKWLAALGPGALASDLLARLREETDSDEDDVTICMLRALTPATANTPRVEEAVVEGGDPTYLVRFLRDCGLPATDAEEAGEALAAAPDGTRMVASVEIRGGRAVVELAPLRGGSSHGTLVG